MRVSGVLNWMASRTLGLKDRTPEMESLSILDMVEGDLERESAAEDCNSRRAGCRTAAGKKEQYRLVCQGRDTSICVWWLDLNRRAMERNCVRADKMPWLEDCHTVGSLDTTSMGMMVQTRSRQRRRSRVERHALR